MEVRENWGTLCEASRPAFSWFGWFYMKTKEEWKRLIDYGRSDECYDYGMEKL
ncbi:hypothetical protein Scep_024246 [Stephania cephalantha]|uniref:Uncharacterized protein n=1 Tax=Stephania cephalantha TaxID=152367 RepID=A0AAP0HY34_9MAGN